MKKMLSLTLGACLAVTLFAEEAENKTEAVTDDSVPTQPAPELSSIWPSPFAICQWPRSPDVIGLRLTLPFSTSQLGVTGIDVGLWGYSRYFDGFQFNVLRNSVRDNMGGLQVGLYNSIGTGEMLGAQVGLWNEAESLRGLQVGLVNVIGEGTGFQVGVINRANTFSGYQVGVINVIRNSNLQFVPVLNIGF